MQSGYEEIVKGVKDVAISPLDTVGLGPQAVRLPRVLFLINAHSWSPVLIDKTSGCSRIFIFSKFPKNATYIQSQNTRLCSPKGVDHPTEAEIDCVQTVEGIKKWSGKTN